ncbi:DUF4261 domain-containing protein [Corynebacterium neomassiliense]|uniref:DUF4261 domain-containing protein n=1 Tax=Corynebacterium neomassiliense TaxID=2079482 RepID=UPI00103259E3|nr:DUF4261 domain-containing protein [Corynebacterium neomassiliense]
MTIIAGLIQNRPDPNLTGDRLRQQMLADYPDLSPTLLSVHAADRPGENHPVYLTYGDRLIAMTGVPAPVGDGLDHMAQESPLWPDDVPTPGNCGAQKILTVLRPDDDTLSRSEETRHIAAMDDATLLSRAMAAAIAVSDSIAAVYFASAGHVAEPTTFREMALEAPSASLLSAWVSRNIAVSPHGVVSGYTRGMDMLGLMDIEIIESPESAEDTFMRLTAISTYQFQNGPVIGDGDSLGGTEDVELLASHAPSVNTPAKTVLRLTFANSEEVPARQKRKRWFRRR